MTGCGVWNMIDREIGRPTKLTQDLVDKANEYLLDGYKDFGNIVPSIAGLGCYLGINRSSIYEYKDQDSDLGKQFSNTLDSILMKQEMLLINGGLSQTFSGTITKLMLANHGYSDKVQSDVTTNGDSINNNPTVIELVAHSVDGENQ